MQTAPKRFIPAKISSRFPNLVMAQSTRLGGQSPVPFASLNLGLHTADAMENALQNRVLLCQSLGIAANQLAGGHQVHGSAIQLVSSAGQAEGYDAFITNTPAVFLSITIADCTPILLYDPVTQSVGAAHAGWRGTVAHIASKTLKAMQDHFGSLPANCYAYIGACINADDYEVDADVADHFAAPFKRWDAKRKKYYLDLKTANQMDLEEAGVPSKQIEISPYSTLSRNDLFFSYRKEGKQSGRGLAVVGIKNQESGFRNQVSV